MKIKHLSLAGLLLTAGWIGGSSTVAGQESIVPQITLASTNSQRSVVVTWPSFPGKTYDLLVNERLGDPFTNRTDQPVQARSTIGQFADTTDSNARFYQIRERGTPPGNTAPITTATLAEVEKVLGLTFTPAQRSQLLNNLTAGPDHFTRAGFEKMRQIRLLNSDPPALVFDPRPSGFRIDQTQKPILWSAPPNVAMPANLADLAFYSVRELAQLIRMRQLTSLALTQLCLDRLKRYDPQLRCVITLTEELALAQAARADAEIAAGNYRGPLHGIPYGIKDLFSTRQYPTTWGATPFKDQRLDEDAAVIQKLESAGAVRVAKLSMGALAYNDVWFGGQTRNPWNLSQGSSGSSAGSAAAVSAGLVPFAIGTETVGSIVSPATRCRVTGLRPSFGRVSRRGAMSVSWSMDKVGPICRTVEDCAIVFDAIRGFDSGDPGSIDAPFDYDTARELRNLRIGHLSFVDSAVVNRLAAFIEGSNVVRLKLPSYPLDAMANILFVEAAAAFDELTRSGGDAFVTENDWPHWHRAARTIPAVEYLRADRLRRKLIEDMSKVFETVDVIVTTNADGSALLLTNLTGHPCVVVPNGGGTSLTFIGQLYDEATILSVAKAYQDATTFHVGKPLVFVK